MSIASAVSASKKSSSEGSTLSKGKSYKLGKTPTHTLSIGKGADKESRTYTTLAFLFPTAFGTDPNAMGGAEMLPRTEEDAPIQKNPLVKYWVTKDKENNLVVRKRVKANEEDERGVFSTVAQLKEVKMNSGKTIFVGDIDPETTLFVNSWAPKK